MKFFDIGSQQLEKHMMLSVEGTKIVYTKNILLRWLGRIVRFFRKDDKCLRAVRDTVAPAVECSFSSMNPSQKELVRKTIRDLNGRISRYNKKHIFFRRSRVEIDLIACGGKERKSDVSIVKKGIENFGNTCFLNTFLQRLARNSYYSDLLNTPLPLRIGLSSDEQEARNSVRDLLIMIIGTLRVGGEVQKDEIEALCEAIEKTGRWNDGRLFSSTHDVDEVWAVVMRDIVGSTKGVLSLSTRITLTFPGHRDISPVSYEQGSPVEYFSVKIASSNGGFLESVKRALAFTEDVQRYYTIVDQENKPLDPRGLLIDDEILVNEKKVDLLGSGREREAIDKKIEFFAGERTGSLDRDQLSLIPMVKTTTQKIAGDFPEMLIVDVVQQMKFSFFPLQFAIRDLYPAYEGGAEDVYELVDVVKLAHNHYTYYHKEEDKWYCYNDIAVSDVPEADVQSVAMKSARSLMFRKIMRDGN